MEPFDIRIENLNIHARMKENNCDNSNLRFWGSVCNDYVLAYDICFPNSIVCMENGTADVIISFETIKEAVEFFVPKLITLYDLNHRKIRPNMVFKGIPALENSAMDINEIL